MKARWWLKGATVDGRDYENTNTKEFLLFLEDMEAIPSIEDVGWLNALCQTYLKRDFIIGGKKAALKAKAEAELSYDKVNIEDRWDRTKVKR